MTRHSQFGRLRHVTDSRSLVAQGQTHTKRSNEISSTTIHGKASFVRSLTPPGRSNLERIPYLSNGYHPVILTNPQYFAITLLSPLHSALRPLFHCLFFRNIVADVFIPKPLCLSLGMDLPLASHAPTWCYFPRVPLQLAAV